MKTRTMEPTRGRFGISYCYRCSWLSDLAVWYIQMAQAGFVYTPQSVGDDTVTCLYCNLALGGWDKEDDPMYVSS